MLGYMVAANVTQVFKPIIQSSVSRDIVTDTLKTEELDVIIPVLRLDCAGNRFFQLHYGRRSKDQLVFKGREKGKGLAGNSCCGFKGDRKLLSQH